MIFHNYSKCYILAWLSVNCLNFVVTRHCNCGIYSAMLHKISLEMMNCPVQSLKLS
jgi:hypothetical protein